MGTQSAPNIIIPIIDYASGSLDSNLNVKLLKYGGTLGTPADEYELTEIGSSGRYALSTAVGADAIPQDIYSVYVDSGGSYQLRGIYLHGGDMIKDHILRTDNPHGVIASQVTITDTGSYYTGANVDAVLQEIGSTLNTKADINNTLLLNDTAQSVVSAKPKITNFDADKVDGKHANDAPSNLMILDGDGLVPLEKIPDSLTGKDASTVAGKAPGNGNNNLAIISDSISAGKIHSSLLGKGTGGGNGLDADKVDGKHASEFAPVVHAHDDEYVNEGDHTKAQHDAMNIDADKVDGKDADDLDNVRTSTANRALDNPPADLHGGGTIWFDKHTASAAASTTIDTSIDWRDRWVVVEGYIRNNSNTYLPGSSQDHDIRADIQTNAYKVHVCFYTEDGGVAPKCYLYHTGGYVDYVYLWVDIMTGELKVYNSYSYGGHFSMGLKISYSPKQNHY